MIRTLLPVKFFIFLASTLLCGAAGAQLRLPFVIGSNMVLQHGRPLPVWGYAAAGERVTVQFKGQIKTAVTDAAGQWRLQLDSLAVSAQPADMLITAKNSSIRLSNILVGEVWLCSGQSNMEFSMAKSGKFEKVLNTRLPAPENELDKADNPLIRIFLVRNDYSKPHPRRHTWDTAAGTPLRDFSAPGYYFAKELYKQLQVPIGIISASVSGSRIEPWMPPSKSDTSKSDDSETGKFYVTMIRPLAPFALRGFLWYQGESNCFLNDTVHYANKMETLIKSWRGLWSNNKMPFYYVQLAPFYYSRSKDGRPHTEQTLAEFREQQFIVMNSIPYTGMIVTTDLNDKLDDIHPTYKWEIGRRLALLALAKDYQEKVEYSGPRLRTINTKGNSIGLGFGHADDGLVSIDGKPLDWFEISGDNNDNLFLPAHALIKGNTLIVSAPGIAHPRAVRFAWNEAAQPNLFNKEGLPAIPFNTLECKGVTKEANKK